MLGFGHLITATAEKVTTRNNAGEAKKPRYSESGTRLYEGNVRLRIATVLSYQDISRFARILMSAKNIKVISYVWSEEDGFILTATVLYPLDLVGLLRVMPEVVEAKPEYNKNKDPEIFITLKSA